MPSIKTFVVLLCAVLLLPCVPSSAGTAPAAPAQDPAVQPTRLLDICPDLELYPPVGSKPANSRPSLIDFSQQDYPVLIYDSRTQDRYWLEPPTTKKDWTTAAGNPPITKLDRVFTPSTFTIEKLIIAVCGLHFGQTATTTPVSTLVPSGDQVDAGEPAASTTPQAQDLLTMEFVQPTETAPARKPACNKLDIDYGTTKADLDKFKKAYLAFRTLIASSGSVVLNEDLFSSQSIHDLIDKAYQDIISAKDKKKSSIDLAHFEIYSNTAQSQYKQLTAAVNGYNTAVANQHFYTDDTAVTKALATLAADSSRLQTDLAALPAGETCGNEVRSFEDKLSARIDTTTNALQSIGSAQENLQLAQLHLVRNMHLLNVWYQESGISSLRGLAPATANTLLQISFSVTDPPATALYKVIEVSDLSSKAPAKTPTTITIDKTDPKKVTVTVDNASSPSVTVNTDTDGDSSVKVQVPEGASTQPPATNNTNAPSGKSTDNTATGGNTGPAATITSTTVGKSGGNTTTGGNTDPSTAPTTQTSKSSFMERHRWVNFAATGGFLGTRFTSTTYSALTLPVTTVITTVTTTSVPTTPPTITVGTPTVTPANYAFATTNGPIQQTAVAGLTWYPFGHDTYPITRLRALGPFLSSYSFHSTPERFGFFVGTSVSSLGPFTLGPSFDIVSGLQLYSGVVLENRTRLAAGIIPCIAVAPVVATTSSTTSQTSPGGITTTSTVTTQTTSNCANTNATVLSNTTVPTNSALTPAWGFGIMFNSGLWKYFAKGS